MTKLLRLGLGLLCLLGLACSPPPPPVAPAAAPAPAPPPAAAPAAPSVAAPEEGVDDGDPGPLPVTAADPTWGRREAPVTLVLFADFQCPFSARLHLTLAQLRRAYGPDQLRIAWKNNPLPFHDKARPAHLAAMALFAQLGDAEFWTAYDTFFTDQQHLEAATRAAVERAGLTPDELDRAAAKVDADLALGKTAGVTGTPASFINGVFVSGAQPYEKFASLVDEQLGKAKALVASGTPPRRVYAELSRAQKQKQPSPAPAKPAEDDRTVWRVPLGKSPVRGKPTALVTIVEFAESQCPFCEKVAPTIQQVVHAYGEEVRLVFKHDPLPFHVRAEPAAELSLEARAQKGDAGFWAAHDLLFHRECVGSPSVTDSASCASNGGTWIQNQSHLEDADLIRYATLLGLDAKRAQAAITGKKYAAVITEDLALADDVQANGVPHFFINGRRLVGAQPIEKFRAVIDEELAKARELVKQGLPAAKVYDSLQATAKGPPEPERKTVPAPTAANPAHGPAGARVVVQIFSDFQCPFCKRVMPTLEELENLFPGKIRLVWRNRPLPMHPHAELAAEAAMEAFAQKGAAGFWAMSALLFAGQPDPGGLERAALEGYAGRIGLDPARFAAALDTGAHKARIDADVAVADDAGINGTPGFVINGYFVNGAQPLGKFKKVVERILAEGK